MAGGWSYVVVTSVTWSLHEGLAVSAEIAFGSGILLALFMNVFLLKRFVFRSDISYWETGLKFILTSVLIRAAEFFLFVVFLSFGIYYLVASTVAMMIGAATKYVVLRAFVYR